MYKSLKSIVLLSLLVLFSMVACSDSEPSPMPEPATETPADVVPEEEVVQSDDVEDDSAETDATNEETIPPTAEPAEGVDAEETISAELPADIVAQLDAFLESQTYTEGGNPRLAAPGLVLYVETPDGQYLNAAGVANLEDGTAIETDDRLEIGSNTKSMTIVLLMQLVEHGLISLDDPLSQYLPDQAALFPDGDQITIRQLAQHTAGLYDYADNIIAAGVADQAAMEAGFLPTELVQDAADNGSPHFAPGEEGQWHYSNTGYVLLGMIIESLTSESLGDLFQSQIFDPLGMDSAVFIEGVPKEGEITTRGYWWQDGERIDATNWNGSQGWAAGANAMTAVDLATYGKALSSGGFFKNPETLAEMLTFDSAALMSLGGSYGLGLQDFAGDGTVWGHAGQTLGFQSLWFTNPEAGIVVAGLTNSASYSADAFLNVINILNGRGAQPVGPITLLPVGNIAPSTWEWMQFVSPTETTDVAADTQVQLVLGKDQSATVNSSDCGSAFGTFTTDGVGNISFEIDESGLVCDETALTAQLLQQLNDAPVSWQVANGMLNIELPADAGTLILSYNENPVPIASPSSADTEAPINWHWVSFDDPINGDIEIGEEGSYIFTMIDGTLIVGTGCRVATGDYETDGDSLSLLFDVPEKTDESCEEGSFADQFYELLQAAESLVADEQLLTISLADDGGTLTFEPLQ